MERPETRFAWNGDIALAYQVLGEGGPDLLYVPGWVSNVELNWDHPSMTRFLRALARKHRLIAMDPRGTGCSDRGTPRDVPQLDTMIDDLAAVMDAAGSERSVILATNEQGFVGCMFAATYPERTAGLILYEASATFRPVRRDAMGVDRRSVGPRGGAVPEAMGEPTGRARRCPRDRFIDGRRSRLRGLVASVLLALAGSRRGHRRRESLPVHGHPRNPAFDPCPGARHRSSRRPRPIMGAGGAAPCPVGRRRAFEEIPGRDTWLWLGEQGPVHAAIDVFVAEIARERSDLESVLATVLFTDIVGSTEKLAELGDRAWNDLVERHHSHVRALLERYRGVEIDTAGDGFFATFDGPARAIRCARSIVESARPLGIEVRAGLHTGECERIDGKVGGIAVNISARVGAAAAPSEVLVSHTVKDLMVGSGAGFEDRGERELRGIPGTWRLYAVT